MGLDFIKKAAPAFHKVLDRRAVALRTPTLFSRTFLRLHAARLPKFAVVPS